ncbi:MAG: hypothetical protein AAGE94_26265, partial [Acidobacteriota bacterium]
MPDPRSDAVSTASPTARALDRLLVAAVWRRARWPLVAVAAVVVSGLAAIVADLPLFVAATWQDETVHDTTLHVMLLFAALSLVAALHRGDPALRRWLRRLPIDPARLLVVRVAFAVAAALLLLTVVFLVEWLVTPTLFQPSFAERLNPIEIDTFERLPGVPLVRWQIDGKTREGLLSARSLAALRAGGPHDVGHIGRWQADEAALPRAEPGDLLSRWTTSDWERLHRWFADRLRAADIATGSAIEATLVRYVPEAEYRAEPWRRDGLLRAPGVTALHRVIGFLALVVGLVAITHLVSIPSTRLGRRVGIVTLVAVTAIPTVAGGWLRWLRATDVESGLSGWWVTLPTLPTQVGLTE